MSAAIHNSVNYHAAVCFFAFNNVQFFSLATPQHLSTQSGGGGGKGGGTRSLSPLMNFFPVTTLWSLQRGIQCTLSFIGGFTVAHIPQHLKTKFLKEVYTQCYGFSWGYTILIPSTAEVIHIHENDGHKLCRNYSYGRDPLSGRTQLQELRERDFFALFRDFRVVPVWGCISQWWPPLSKGHSSVHTTDWEFCSTSLIYILLYSSCRVFVMQFKNLVFKCCGMWATVKPPMKDKVHWMPFWRFHSVVTGKKFIKGDKVRVPPTCLGAEMLWGS